MGGVKSFDLTTLYRPNVAQLNQSFGRKLSSVVRNLRRIYLISIVDYLEKSDLVTKYNSKRGLVTINTHGDKIPYYHRSCIYIGNIRLNRISTYIKKAHPSQICILCLRCLKQISSRRTIHKFHYSSISM